MKLEGLLMVARDGIEPPTPAFSGLRSTTELPDQEFQSITPSIHALSNFVLVR